MTTVTLRRSLRRTLRPATVAALGAALAFSAPHTLAGSPGEELAAAPHPLCAAAEEGVECLVAVINHLSQVQLDEPVKTLLIGNPAIADVSLIGPQHAVITARSVGSTNIFFLDADNEPIAQYRVFVREGDMRQVMLRRGPAETVVYQCAPRCERALSQNDSPTPFGDQIKIVRGASSLALDAATDSAGGDSE